MSHVLLLGWIQVILRMDGPMFATYGRPLLSEGLNCDQEVL